MTGCQITFEVLLDYAEGRLDRAIASRVSSHLSGSCQSCEGQLAWIKEFSATLTQATQLELLRPPPSVLARAKAIGNVPKSTPKIHSLPQLIAKLLFDSTQPMVPVGVRGTTSRDNKRVYATDDYYLDLWEEEQKDGSWYEIGQVLSRDGGGAISLEDVQLVDGDGNARLATFEGMEFHLPDTQPGIYTMILRLADAVIKAPHVRVGQ